MDRYKHLLILLCLAAAPVSAQTNTRNVVLITADGLRWEEVFRGAEQIPLTKEFGNFGNSNTIRTNFWRETPEARRETLLPFLWGTVVKQGQLWGNRDRGSEVRVSNGHNFSYPGYNELLTGYADPKIDSNDKVLNANTNVFEWLNTRPAFRGRVAAAVNWDVLAWILNAPRAGFPIWSAWDVPDGTRRLPVPDALTEMADRSRTVWANVILDTFVGYAAKHAVRTLQPRALYVAFGETDDWAHEGNFERYLKAAREFDRFIGELWGSRNHSLNTVAQPHFSLPSITGAALRLRGGGIMARMSPIPRTLGSPSLARTSRHLANAAVRPSSNMVKWPLPWPRS